MDIVLVFHKNYQKNKYNLFYFEVDQKTFI